MDTTYQTNSGMYDTSTAATSAGASSAMMLMFGVLTLITLALTVVMIVSMWKLFEKAGKPGWASIVPFYNTYVMVEIAGRPAWWFAIILLVPFVNIVFSIMVTIDFVKAFGKGTGFAVLSIFFPYVAFSIMAFDKNVRYVNGASAPVAAASAYSAPVMSQPVREAAAPEMVQQAPAASPFGPSPTTPVVPEQQSQAPQQPYPPQQS